MRLLLPLTAWLLACVFSATAWAEDLVVSRAMLEDRTGALTIEDVVHAQFQPVGPILSQGYTDAAQWIRLQVRAPQKGGDVALRIRPAFLDEVRLYEPDPERAGRWRTRVTGDRHGYRDRDLATVTLGFLVRPQAPQTTYYLRLKTTSASILNIEALEPRSAHLRDLRLHAFQVFYLGFMLCLLFWAAHDYVTHREPVTAAFIAYQLTYIAFDLAIIGYYGPFVPIGEPWLADAITSVLVTGAIFMGALFHLVLFRLYAPPVFLMRALYGLALLFPAQLVAIALGHARLALHANSLVILLFAFLFPALAFAARRESAPGLRVLRLIISLQAVSLLVSMLPLLGLVQAIEWNLHATPIHGLISGTLMFVMLHMRSSQMLRDGQRARLDLELSQRQLLLERQQREEQSRFIAMLTHELKTPVSVVRMTLGLDAASARAKNHAQTALDDIDALIERCNLSDQLHQQRLMVRSAICRLEEVLDELRSGRIDAHRLAIRSAALPELSTDPQLLRVILGNLIDNALKYSAAGTQVEIHVEPAGRDGHRGIRMTIHNQPGVAGLPDSGQVFTRYYRSPRAYAKTGSGQGLYLVWGLARLLGGQVEYDVFEEQARFTLWMPC